MQALAVFCVALLSQVALGPVADRDATFLQDTSTFYTMNHGLPSDDVTSIVVTPDGALLAATALGLANFDPDTSRWTLFDNGPSFRVEKLHVAGNMLLASTAQRLARRDGDKWVEIELAPDVRVTTVAAVGEAFAVGTRAGVIMISAGTAVPVPRLDGDTRAIVPDGDRFVVGTDLGLFSVRAAGEERRGGGPRPVIAHDARYSWSVRDVGAMVVAGDSLWFGAENGVGKRKDEQWTLFTGKEGLPYNKFTCAAASTDGTVWFGTERGVVRYDGKAWAYRASQRWLPDDAVRAIAVDASGSAWVATSKGISCLARVPMTLAKKADAFESIIDERHKRMGFVLRATLRKPGDVTDTWINHSDNDGLYTSMYGASQAFRYGATKDPAAKERAKEAFKACKLLFDVTGIPGFPARSVIPADWDPDPNIAFNEAANLAAQKEDPLWKNILPRWPKSADGKYMWKCDTSSDEICGHYFFYAAYFDHVAETQEEKKEVVELVRALTDHIVDNGFKLIDHDGKPTRWGNWSPEYCNSIPGGYADRGLQAVEMFAFLNIAEHVTGDAKYRNVIKELCDKHAYHINAIYGRWVFPPDHVVPWDSNLAFLSYYPLLKYEHDPELVRAFRTSLDRGWQFLARQNDPFFNFVFAAVFPDKDKPVVDDVVLDFQPVLQKAIPTLESTPELLIGWRMENSHRLDVMLDPTPRARKGTGWSIVTNEAIPIAERSHIRINSDHFALDHEQGSNSEYEGTYYLLPYYMGLLHGFIK